MRLFRPIGPIRGALFRRRHRRMRPPLVPSNEPVMRHARIYMGNDSDFTTALGKLFLSRAMMPGKTVGKATLQRSDDFIRFCCYKHIAEMLTARGGAGEARVVYRWDRDR